MLHFPRRSAIPFRYSTPYPAEVLRIISWKGKLSGQAGLALKFIILSIPGVQWSEKGRLGEAAIESGLKEFLREQKGTK